MSELKTIIDANIKENGNQEITGKVLNYVLNKIAEGTQKDWNESDATKGEYIKGRTHGVTFELVSVEGTLKELGYVPGEYVSVLHYARVNGVLEGKGLYLGGLLYNPIVGEEYIVKYEGPSVYAKVVEVDDGYDVQIKGASDTGKILKVAIVGYKTIDDAYISTDIARKSQVDALEQKVDNLPKGEESGEINNKFEETFDVLEESSTNKLNYAECATGLIAANGYIYTGGSYDAYFYTGFIPVKQGATYTVQRGNRTIAEGRSKERIARYALYDTERQLLADLGSNSPSESVTIPNGAAYIRISVYVISFAEVEAQYYTFVEGTKIIDFEPYQDTKVIGYVLKAECNNDEHIISLINEYGETEIADNSITLSKLNKDKEHNLFANLKDEENWWKKTFSWNGSRSANSSYDSYRLSVKPNTQYIFRSLPNANYARSISEYDINGVFISGSSKSYVGNFTTGANTHFIECSFVSAADNETALLVNEIYEVVANGNAVNAFLPKNIYCAIGRTIELYNEQVCLNAHKYNIQWVCPVGKSLKRKFQINGASEGEHTLSFLVFDDYKNLLYAEEAKLKVVKAEISNTIKIVPVGDSLTNSKQWLSEVENLSSNIEFVGSYQWTMNDSEGDSHSGGHEGRSGFSAKDYATGAVYTYGGESTPNIWWNGSRFSFNAFKSASGLTPNVIQIWVGTNGIALNNEENAGYIKTMVDNIRKDDATIPIIICNTIYKGNQDGIGNQVGADGYSAQGGQWKYNEDLKVMDLMRRLDAMLSSYANLHIINLAVSHDSEYNFGAVPTPVNPRASQTEPMPIEAVHPQVQGYYQIADILFSAYCGVFL